MKKTAFISLFILAVITWREAIALKTKALGDTFSELIWAISEAWKFFIWICGLITGILACHFWWIPACLKCKAREQNEKTN